MERNHVSIEQTYRMMRSMPLGIACIDDQGGILEFNPAAEEITGYSAAEVMGLPHHQILHGVEDIHACPLSNRQPSVAAATTICCKNGRYKMVSMTASPLFDVSNNYLGGLEFFRDITEDKRERERNNFLAMLAHDMKTPVVVMGGFLSRLESGKAGPVTDEQKRDLRLLIEESCRLEGLIDGILQFAKYRIQDYRPARAACNLVEAVERQILLAQEEARKKNIMIRCQCPATPVHVYVDGPMLDRVLANLLDNALKYTDLDGRVLVRISEKGEKVLVEVSDNGRGIPQSELPYIFDVFHRASGEVKGTGLGLAIVKKILEAHGEIITVKSAAGQGTVFSFSIPKATL